MPSLASRAGVAALTAVLAFTTAATAVPTEAEAGHRNRNRGDAVLPFAAGVITGYVLGQTAPARRPRQREQVIIVAPQAGANVYYYDADTYYPPHPVRCRRVRNRNGEGLYEWNGQPAYNCR